MSSAPIILFTYNRPEHTRQTLEALRANRGAADSDLHVYSDAPKSARQAEDVARVRAYLRTIDGFRTIRIVERERNMGLAASIIDGVSSVLEQRPNVIVMEDDMLTSPNFLAFMNAALTTYAGRRDIFSVTGYNYPLPIPGDYPNDAYLSYRSSSWGWGTWPDRWRKVDWALADYQKFLRSPKELALFARGGEDLLAMLKLQMAGKLDSWSIRFDYAHYKHDALCLHAVKSKVQNIGFDGSGVHCVRSDDYKIELDPGDRPFTLAPDLQRDDAILEIFNRRFRPGHGGAAAAPSPAPRFEPIRKIMRSIGLRKQMIR